MAQAYLEIPANPEPAKPWCKYAGGKTKLVPQLSSLLPKKINSYFEPFLGGGALFWELLQTGRFSKAYINDSNKELIDTYIVIQERVADLIQLLSEYTDKNSESFFYKMRDSNPAGVPGIAARFIYLNKTCFNGLYRVNASGKFNVPWGKYGNPTICDEANLRACSEWLRSRDNDIDITCGDFEEELTRACPGSVIYCDPPYVPVSKTSSFTSYGAGGFGLDHQIRLARVARELVKRGVFVVLSNADSPIVRDLYHGFEIHEVSAPRAINSVGLKRGNVGELIIVGRTKE